MRVVGFDPGTSATGYGLVCFEEGRLRLDGCGVWRPPAAMTLAEKLDFLFSRRGAPPGGVPAGRGLGRDGVHGQERLLGDQARPRPRRPAGGRGRSAEFPVFEYEPRLVKKALVGYGNAEKPQVRAMVLSLVARQRDRVPLDAADALAVAICHIHACTGRP